MRQLMLQHHQCFTECLNVAMFQLDSAKFDSMLQCFIFRQFATFQCFRWCLIFSLPIGRLFHSVTDLKYKFNNTMHMATFNCKICQSNLLEVLIHVSMCMCIYMCTCVCRVFCVLPKHVQVCLRKKKTCSGLRLLVSEEFDYYL